MVISDMCYNGFTASPSVGRSSDFMMLVKSVLLLHRLFYTSIFFVIVRYCGLIISSNFCLSSTYVVDNNVMYVSCER